ncbi:hypothetical protein RRG08_064886 [Elysia crispata]|uniref:Uncharacterized protein n=1 Tax=Elysia crispata TaxID=231223 RepID=A0AAE1AY05_9GAST|nr:hypothetical protein RRG08_064886 [Elysia crispata]
MVNPLCHVILLVYSEPFDHKTADLQKGRSPNRVDNILVSPHYLCLTKCVYAGLNTNHSSGKMQCKCKRTIRPDPWKPSNNLVRTDRAANHQSIYRHSPEALLITAFSYTVKQGTEPTPREAS